LSHLQDIRVVDFALELAKYPKSILPQQQFRECVSLLFCSISDAACLKI